MKAISHFSALVIPLMLAACYGNHGWSVKGSIEDPDEGKKLALEGFNNGIWYNIDSLEVKRDGSFEYVSDKGAAYPDIFRLSLDGKSIYFPIDSIETIVITARADNFDRGYTVEGSESAVAMMEIDREIAEVADSKGDMAALTDSVLKRRLNEKILADSSGIVAYYVINKTLGGQPLYSPTNRRDVAMLGAVAQKFSDLMPDDPRTEYITRMFIANRSALNPGSETVMEVNATGLFEISLYDNKGKKQSLVETADKGDVVLLSFTRYDSEPSLAYNVELNRIYEAYRSRGLEIFQVAFDDNEVSWKESAGNLPWITVHNPAAKGIDILRKYNVGSFPVTFVIDRNGDLVERITDPNDIESAIKKHI